jgi:hypothetical protein
MEDISFRQVNNQWKFSDYLKATVVFCDRLAIFRDELLITRLNVSS